jgi:Tol biopolymer transport system component/DNA-binding winged helix-turn-helix (wHTH) protein
MCHQTRCLYEFGPFRLDATKRLLRRDGEVVPLTPKTLDVLLALIESAGEVVEKDELMRRVWPDSIVEEVNLAYHISLLRKALGESRSERHYIVTMPGRGYRFVADVKILEGEGLEPATQQQNGWGLAPGEGRGKGDQSTGADEANGESARAPAQAFEVSQGSLTPPDARSGQSTAEPAERQAAEAEEREAAAATSGSEHFIREPRHRRRSVLLALMIVAALAGGVLFGLGKLTRQKPRVSASLKITKLTTTGQAHSPAISPDGKYVAFVSSDAGVSGLWIRQIATASNVQIVPDSKALYQGLTFSPDGHYLYYAGNEKGEGELALYQMPALGGTSRRLLTGMDKFFGLSPDGGRAAFRRSERALVIANLDGTGERTLATFPSPNDFYAAAWSPDGRRIVCAVVRQDSQGMDASLIEVEAEGGTQRTLTRKWNWIRQAAWLPDGSGLLMVANDKQGSPSQLWQLSYASGEARRVTTDLNSYADLSLTADAAALVATRSSTLYNLWLVPYGAPQQARQITSGTEPDGYSGLDWTPDGKIVYSSFASGRPEVWVMEADGSSRKQLTTDLGSDRLGLAVSPDGRYIAFVAARGEDWRGGDGNIWRIESDGSNPRQLTDAGHLPLFSPDARFIFYRRGNAVWTVPTDGGESVQLTGPYSYLLDISPDGKLIAYRDHATRKIGVVSAAGGEPLRSFDHLPSTDQRPLPRWTPDGRALSYVVTREGVSNIWLQPVDGAAPKPLTDFKSERIHYYAWSRDGKYLACARGSRVSDVVMISNFR